jgi:hypothetical protein
MQPNNLHNLMTQMVQEQKSLWRIEKHYINEAETSEEKALWEEMQEDKKKHIEDFKKLIKENM